MENSDTRQQQLDAWLALTGQAASPHQTVRLPVLSGSMLPSIPIGTILEIEVTNAVQCRFGDVIVFQEGPQRLTAHRILACLKFGSLHWLLQKGDNNPLGHWIRASQVRGRVVRILPPVRENSPDDPAPKDHAEAYDPTAARESRRRLIRNVVLKWPRKIRDFAKR
jgi:signal peptidase I